MSALLAAVGLFVITGFAALLMSKQTRWATAIGVCGVVGGSLLGLLPVVGILLGAPAESLRLPLDSPYPGLWSFFVEVDALSAFFLIPVFILAALSAVYGSEYLRPASGRDTRAPGIFWFFYNLTIAALVLVIVAKNGLLFLLAWEIMTLASFFLVTYEHDKESVRQAGWTYMIASHLGTAFLLVMFVLMGAEGGSLDFDAFASHADVARHGGLLFVLAVIGFGTKAGFMPLHVWLPEAHPAAPSPVSALMSGVIIKTGIYGIVRMLTLLGQPPPWWGWLLVAIGVSSGVLGVLFALAQHDLKRLLAYHSIENIGIITLGLGVGVLGLSCHNHLLAALGFAGGLLHVLNHALFKGLLFLGAGAVAHSTGTREIDQLGGLLKRMPMTALCFLIGSIAISGLPPLNGFISEFLIYLGAFNGVLGQADGLAPPMAGWLLAVIAALALIGGLAAACFCKAFGIVFLGEPRSGHAAHAHEPGLLILMPMLLLAAACIGLGLLAPFVARALQPVVGQVTGQPVGEPLLYASQTLSAVLILVCGFLTLLAALFVLRLALLSRWPAARAVTWDCGYARPTPRMQYTASSFAQPLTYLFRIFLHTRRHGSHTNGLFPKEMAFATETPDVVRENFFAPLFRGVSRGLSHMRGLQHGHVQLYVLYIALTLLVLLFWKLG